MLWNTQVPTSLPRYLSTYLQWVGRKRLWCREGAIGLERGVFKEQIEQSSQQTGGGTLFPCASVKRGRAHHSLCKAELDCTVCMSWPRDACIEWQTGPSLGQAELSPCIAPRCWHGTAGRPKRHANGREHRPSVPGQRQEGGGAQPCSSCTCTITMQAGPLGAQVPRYLGRHDSVLLQQPRPFVVSGASHLDHVDFQFPIAPAPQHAFPRVQERGDVDDGRRPEPAHLPLVGWFWPASVELPASRAKAPSAQQSSDMAQCFDAELPPPCRAMPSRL